MNMKRLIKKLYLKTLHIPENAEMDMRILRDALAAMDEAMQKEPVAIQPAIWRMILGSKVVKVTAFAVIIIATFAIGYLVTHDRFQKDRTSKVIINSKQQRTDEEIARSIDSTISKRAASKGVVAMMQPVLPPPGSNEVRLDKDLLGHKRNLRVSEDGWIQIGKGIFWYYNGGTYLNFTQEDVRVYVTADDEPQQLAGLRFSKPEDIEQLRSALEELTEPTILWCECPLPEEFSQLTNLDMIAALQRVPTRLGLFNLDKTTYMQRYQPVKFSDLSPLSGLTGLASLNLSGCDQLTDLSPLATLTNLTSLDLSGCDKITDLSPLANLANLELLDLSAWNVDTELCDISPLADLTALRSLNLRLRTNLSDLTPLGELAELESLNLMGCSPQISDLSSLANLTKLKSLKISSLWNAGDLSQLGKLTSLEFLTIGPVNRRVTDTSSLANLKKLKHLELDQWQAVTDISSLAGLNNLISLRLHALRQLSDMSPLANLTNLESLDLSNCKQILDLSPLANLMKLKSLNLRACKSVSDLSPLANLTELKDVGLQFCPNITDLSPLWEVIRQGADIKINAATGTTNVTLKEQLSDIQSQIKTESLVSGKFNGKSEKSLADADSRTSAKSKTLRSRGLASSADRAGPDRKKLEAQATQIQEMVVTNDIEGLIEMLSIGEFPSKVAAAEHLGKFGDERALPELKQLNEKHGGWFRTYREDYDTSGAFAVAICKILMWDLPEEEQIDALFDLLEGRGPAGPSVEPAIVTIDSVSKEFPMPEFKSSFDVGKRVAAELDKFDNPLIVARLRQTENMGAAITAVWMEVREMDEVDAIPRCLEIIHNEGGAQGYGAIKCLGKFGDNAIDALDQLCAEGYDEAIRTLGYSKKKPEILKLICWHLVNNRNVMVRLKAIDQFYGDVSLYQQPALLQALIEALYDPHKGIRRNAAQLLSYAAYRDKPQLEKFEDNLLIALKHPDEDVRKYILKALENLDSERLDEEMPDPPSIRTDLEGKSMPLLTSEQKLKSKTGPLEKEATKALKMGPPEKAITLYEELLELKPDYEPYEQAIAKAKAYVRAAEAASEHWYPDAPYIDLKGRYSYYLTSEPKDTSTLKEEFDLALFLEGDGFEGWTNIFGKDPKGKDQFFKALKLYEHIVEFYPENEYLVIRSLAATSGLKLNLYKDVETYVLEYVDVFATPVEEIVDSTDHRRNKPLEETGGKTQAQLDFELYYKDHMRERLIELCSAAVRSKPYNAEDRNLFDEIIERCAQTDPKVVEMAKAAKAKVEQEQKIEAEREKAAEHH